MNLDGSDEMRSVGNTCVDFVYYGGDAEKSGSDAGRCSMMCLWWAEEWSGEWVRRDVDTPTTP